jgi:hypothetical protein
LTVGGIDWGPASKHWLGRFLRNNASIFVREILLRADSPIDAHIPPAHIEKVVQEHFSGRRNWAEEIDRLVALSLFLSHVASLTSHAPP